MSRFFQEGIVDDYVIPDATLSLVSAGRRPKRKSDQSAMQYHTSSSPHRNLSFLLFLKESSDSPSFSLTGTPRLVRESTSCAPK